MSKDHDIAALDAIEWVYIAEEGFPDADTTVLIAFDHPDSDEIEIGAWTGEKWVDTHSGFEFNEGHLEDQMGLVYAWAYAPSKPPRRGSK